MHASTSASDTASTCLGQWLLRLDAEVALNVHFRRYPNLRIDGPVENRGTLVQHGPERLYVAG